MRTLNHKIGDDEKEKKDQRAEAGGRRQGETGLLVEKMKMTVETSAIGSLERKDILSAEEHIESQGKLNQGRHHRVSPISMLYFKNEETPLRCETKIIIPEGENVRVASSFSQ